MYGWELNEFDPFFNYRATQYILDNGINSYLSWNDNLSWYPNGRDISLNSQVFLHITTAISYWIFGMGSELYDFTIIFPVIIGSLTTVVIFFLVRLIGGTSAGLFASLLFSISLPILLRGMVGWFKSEPLGLLFGILSTFLFLYGLKNKNTKYSYFGISLAGILAIFSISAWGGSQFFIIPIGFFIFIIPFFKNDSSVKWKLLLFSTFLLSSSLLFERLSFNFITGSNGLLIISSTIFAFSLLFLKNKNETFKNNFLPIALVIMLVIISITIISDTIIFESTYSHRYLNSINPFLTNSDPLVDSISEHQTVSIGQSFLLHTILMIFSGIGIWLIFEKNIIDEKSSKFIIFAMIFAIAGVYISSTFARLEIFASISLIIFSSIALSILVKHVIKKKNNENKKFIFLPLFIIGIFALLLSPFFILDINPVYVMASAPPTILNGGTMFNIATNDWKSTLEWINQNTDKNAVIASWWDYGYWIQTLGERATISDNSTLSTKIIQNIAKILLDNPESAWNTLNEMEVDYFVIFVTAERLPNEYNGDRLYFLGGGGDESKKNWFIKIAEKNTYEFLYADGFSGNENFWNNTTLGQMIPYSLLGYGDPKTNQDYLEYVPGTIGIYKKEIKFSENDPFNLVYASPSFYNEQSGPVLGVFVYQINKEYLSNNLDLNISP